MSRATDTVKVLIPLQYKEITVSLMIQKKRNEIPDHHRCTVYSLSQLSEHCLRSGFGKY